MSINEDNTPARTSVSDLEAFQNAYLYFVSAVGTLAASPEQQCEWMGDFNVAWELKDDVSAGKFLVGREMLSPAQENAILRLVSSLQAIPSSVLPAGSGREVNLKAMQDPSWSSLRVEAARLLKQFATLTQEVESALRVGKNAP